MDELEDYMPAPRHLTSGVFEKQNDILREEHRKIDSVEDPTLNEAARKEKQTCLDSISKNIDEIESTIASINEDEFIMRNDLLRQKVNLKATTQKTKDKNNLALARQQWSQTPLKTTKF